MKSQNAGTGECHAADKRNPVIDNLYTYGMILVVLGHVGLDESFSESYLCKWIYAFHMPLFFWIAGFLFSKRKSFRSFLFGKSKRLLIPLFVLTTLAFIPKLFLSSFAIHPLEGGIKGYLHAFIYPYENPIILLWFLPVLFCIYVMAWLISPPHMPKHKDISESGYKIWLTVFWSLSAEVSGLLFYMTPKIELFAVSSILYHFPYFCIGVICRVWLGNKVANPDSGLFGWQVAFAAFIVFCILVLTDINKYILAMTGILAALSFSGVITRIKISVFHLLRPYTFTIYLLQWFPQCFVRIVCFNMMNIDIYICYVLMFFSGLVFPYLTGKVCDRLLPREGFGKYFRLAIGL